MGRAKLEMKFREEARSRFNTYKATIRCMEKKAEEMSVLYSINVLFASFSSDLKVLHFWPKNPSEFHRILGWYKSVSQNPPCVIPSLPLNSIFQEEVVAMNIKLEEVRQRIRFLEAEKIIGSKSSSQQICKEAISSMEDERDDGCASLVAANKEEDDENIYYMLEDLGDDLIISDIPSISCKEIFSDDWNIYSENYFVSTFMCSDLEGLSDVFSYH